VNGRMTQQVTTPMRRTLSREQHEAWLEFERGADLDVWAPTLEAWAERFPWPPMGDRYDDDQAPSQRSVLWQMLDAWPTEVPRWLRQAPRAASARDVLAYCVRRWHDVREAVGPDPDDEMRVAEIRVDRAHARGVLTRVRDILAGI
jgi:hypothetical protein